MDKYVSIYVVPSTLFENDIEQLTLRDMRIEELEFPKNDTLEIINCTEGVGTDLIISMM